MRVLVVDDHEVVRRGVRSLIESQSDFEVCGEAIDGHDAVDKARRLSPDVIVMDVSMPRLNGLEATPLIRSAAPTSEVLILTQHDSAEMARQAFKAGARGYVVKASIAQNLLTALECVSRHRFYFDSAVSPAHQSTPIDSQEILQRSSALELALRESEELYRSTFEAADLGVAHQAPDGHWLQVNDKLCDIVGYTRAELRQLTFQDITYPDDLPLDLEHLQKMRADLLDRYSAEKRYIRKDGSLVWVNLRVSAVRDRSRSIQRFIVVVEEITQRRAAEHDKYRLAAIVESSDDAIISKDLHSIINSWNEGAQRLFGYTSQEAIGKSITLIIPPDLQNEEKEIIARLKKGERIEHYETVRLTKSGERINVSITVSPIIDNNGRIIGASKIARDISGLKESREQLEARVRQRTLELEEKNKALIEQANTVRELSGRLLRTQDDERRRIARDLHDSAGQVLVALQMNLLPLHQELQKYEATQKSGDLQKEDGQELDGHKKQGAPKLDSRFSRPVAESLGLVDELSKELRTLSYLLHPPLLDEAGLPSALRWYIEGFAERSKINVQLDIAADLGRLPSDMEMAIFRIVQEGLTNIHRHSGSQQAAISLLRDAEAVQLQIQDMGRGLPSSSSGSPGNATPNNGSSNNGSSNNGSSNNRSSSKIASKSRPGVGIQGMSERVTQLGGTFDIQSTSSGTKVNASFPLAQEPAASATLPS
jgi:PAS domain S-box-containing protein